MRIALVVNDTNLLKLLSTFLYSAGHKVEQFTNGETALQSLVDDKYEMLILDWQFPELVGAQFILSVRDKLPSSFPILFMTNRCGEDDIVAGLAAGANDYMIKPIRRGDLIARAQTQLRRAYPNQHTADYFEFGKYVFETGSATLTIAGEFIELTQKEFDLALLLFRNLGRALSRGYIWETVWFRDVGGLSRTMDAHISQIRKKLHLHIDNGFRLTPVYNYGYCLNHFVRKPNESRFVA